MDHYLEKSVKESTRQKRGEEGQRTMPQGIDWQSLLSNNKNKSDLIHRFVEYLKQSSIRYSLTVPLIITEKCKTWKIEPHGVQLLQKCNHKEADSRLASHATIDNVNCIIVFNL